MAKNLSTVRTAVAPITAKPWPSQTEIVVLARQLDNLVSYRARIERVLRVDFRGHQLDGLQILLDEFAVTGAKTSHLEKRLNDLEPAEWRDEDYNLQVPAVSKMLALLVGSFPTSNLPDAAVFTRVMLDDVLARDPDFLSLEGACRKLRQTQKFMPSISEIIEAIKAEKAAWAKRYEALEVIDDLRSELTRRLADERTRRGAGQSSPS